MALPRVLVTCLIAALPVLAQPGAGGPAVSGAHVHLNAANLDATLNFWKDVMGAAAYSSGSVKGVAMLSGSVLFTEAAPTGPSAGSAIDHFAVKVPDVEAFADKIAKTQWKTSRPNPKEQRVMVEGPDGVRIEVIEDNDMYASLEANHIHLMSGNPTEMRDWFSKNLGGRPGNLENVDSLSFPAATLVFGQGESVGTAGRAIDHIAFEVKGLSAFCDKLAANGVKIEAPPHADAALKATIATVTGPSGIRIELIERAGN